MKHISLESGIGGFDYAAEMIGWENVAHCEINEFCQKILKHYWPNAKSYTDIFKMDGRPYRGIADIITCGFPCQPFSVAGKGEGDQDDRFIWPENMRIIREVQPSYVVAENVPGLLNKHPLVFERVCTDLENEGYEVLPISIPACATEKDHIRERWFFIAYCNRYGHWNDSRLKQDRSEKTKNKGNEDKWERHREVAGGVHSDFTDNNGKRMERGFFSNSSQRKESRNQFYSGFHRESWLEAATRLCRVDDGTSNRLDFEAISKAKWYRESIRGYGNAIVWEIAFEIFKAIEQMNNY